MRSISDTIARLSALRGAAADGGIPWKSRLTELLHFGSNPGALRAHVYIPPSIAENPALVVVMHGCTQTAAGYDIGSGWSQMADRHGFVVLFPEQQMQNNPNVCFNWFAKGDTRRDGGEALSIRQMIETVSASHDIDRSRIFATGLSAGGAMTAVMLATYPEVFAGGAVIGGLPYGCADTVPQALDRMRGHKIPGPSELEAVVRSASAQRTSWPTLSIWHGSADATVAPANATALLRQWAALHGVGAAPDSRETIDGHFRDVWHDPQGREVMENFRIAGLGHGTPVKTSGTDSCGQTGAFILEAGISSTFHICRFWGLISRDQTSPQPGPVESEEPARMLVVAEPAIEESRLFRIPDETAKPVFPSSAGDVRKVIEDALRSAGLMR